MSSESVIFRVEDGVAIVQLNEPESRNALSTDIKTRLREILEQVEEDDSVKVLLLSGNGRGFCAGGDIRGMSSKRTVGESINKIQNTTKIVKKVSKLRKPVIAAVHGYAMGAGFSLVLASDIVFAEEGTKFGLSFSKIGLVPDCGLLYFLPKVVGGYRAKELIFMGESISSEDGVGYGFVNRLVAKGSAFDEALAFAKKLTNGATMTVSTVKSILSNSDNMSLDQVIELENYCQTIMQQTADHEEGIRAFLERRPANFRGV
ncbi:enoyl-CoA hydratase/isomerase family protein [Alicyclobacillus dauci]|uniref:Enoyl-CoA hydratase/isomerase family protein n=1 Tax=Alicyclobacillus dauci TaxID=1475485 RepID=A0ABY6Z013_9BACL|nr:enoyl-CoA hydratase/isomerase family protein [Alicyclobacillus dauci]WAH36210.1 enoyl-CoA hydratase/isomerase family protein [Alicyclobacillus dauci]